MKNIYLLTFVISLFASSLSAQKIIKETDEFTGRTVEKTKWEKLISKGIRPTVLNYSIQKEKDSLFFVGRIRVNAGDTVFAIDEGFRIIFLLDNGSSVVIRSIQRVVSRQGGANNGTFGSSLYGAEVIYAFDSNSDIDKLKTNKIYKVRVYTDEGYFEKKIKNKVSLKFMKSINLF